MKPVYYKKNGTVYKVAGVSVPIPYPADDVTYDNTTSQLTATDVQSAIDELSQKEAGVQSDWNESDNTKLDYIKNKPTIPDAQIQSDWSQSDNTKKDYIKNKPTIPDAQIQSDWNQTTGTAKDYIKNKPTLGTASALDVPATGNATSSQVVKGDDTRLSDARTPVSHIHTTSEITDFPTLGTASALDVATSGDASATQVVKGDDSRLSDARTPVSHTHTLSEITDAGTAASKNSTSSVTAGSTDLVESGAVKTAIDNAISGAYKHAGTKTCAELISSLLIASNNGNVYNITDNGTTTSDFIEGQGLPIRAGDNVGIAKISDSIYKFDLLSGFIDTSNFITKSSTSGLVKNDGSIDTTEYAPASSVPAAQIQSDWNQADNTKLDYIKNKPSLGTASAKNAPSSGNAGSGEVVLGNDTRLSDARNAADVYAWAKAETKPSYTKSEVGLGNVDNTSDTTKKSNFTGSIADGNTGFVTGGDAYTELNKKVDAVEGKVLSSNDFTDTLKNKLDGIAANAEVNVQSDWNQTNTDADDYIKNKPANLVQDASYVHTDNNYTTTEKNKLAGIAEGAEVNVQTDWNQNDSTADDFIKNKPEAYDAIWQNNDILPNTNDTKPYLYRATTVPNGAISYVKEELVGGSVTVNQLVQNGNFADMSGWTATNTTYSTSNNVLTMARVSLSGGSYVRRTAHKISGHKYLCHISAKKNNASASHNILVRWYKNGSSGEQIELIPSTALSSSFSTYMNIVAATNDDVDGDVIIYNVSNDTESNDIKDFYITDLTQMFGTAIADLAYSKEQASAGSGIAWLKSYGFFTKDYYPYNAGALQSVKTSAKKIVGSNIWDGILIQGHLDTNGDYVSDTNNGVTPYFLKVKPGQTYKFKTTSFTAFGAYYMWGFNENQSFVRQFVAIDHTSGNSINDNVAIPDDISYIKIQFNTMGTFSGNFDTKCIFKNSATEEDKPYTSTTYPLDSNLELRGLYKLDASNNIVCDGDEYTPDGGVKRRYGIVDLGDLSWILQVSGIFRSAILDRKWANGNFNLFTNKYVTYIGAHSTGANIESLVAENGNMLYVNGGSVTFFIADSAYSSYTADQFKEAIKGTYIIYEEDNAYITTDEATPYQNPQIIHENGTEEFIDTRDYPLPVGHDTGYFTASDEKFFLPPVVDNESRVLCHDDGGFGFKKYIATDNNYTDEEKAKLAAIDTLEVSLDLTNHAIVITQNI